MTIQEAIKSGKPFKRAYEADWAWAIVVPSGDRFDWEKKIPTSLGGYKFTLPPNDILATDWEPRP